MPGSKVYQTLLIGAVIVTTFYIIMNLTFERNNIFIQNSYLMDRIDIIHKDQRVVFSKSQVAIDAEIAGQLQSKMGKNVTKTHFNIREWLDSRPITNVSKMSVAGHPFFHGFEIRNSRLCRNKPIDILIYIQSTPDHTDRRNVIRNTWGNMRLFYNISVETIFILGMTKDPDYQLDIEIEQGSFGDIIQGQFNDTLNGLTYKAITALVWINKHCPHAKLIMKVDDDIFVDTYRVMEELVPLLDIKSKSIVCDHITNQNISRDPKNRWYVHPKYLPDAMKWLPFCSGFFTLMTGDMIPYLYERSFQPEKFVPIDDAYLFGILTNGMAEVKVNNVHDKISYLERPDPHEELKTNGKFEYLAFPTPRKAVDLWNLRSKMLNEWEREHSLFYRVYHDESKPVVIQ